MYLLVTHSVQCIICVCVCVCVLCRTLWVIIHSLWNLTGFFSVQQIFILVYFFKFYLFVVYMYCHKILLLCPQQRWQSILMSMSVCVSVCVCLSVCEHISQTTWAVFTNFVHVAYHHGLVLLWQGDAIPRGRVKFKGFLSGWKCIIWAI